MRSASRSSTTGSALAREVVQVGGEVARGVAVGGAAVALDHVVEHPGAVLLAAVEHHVLEQVRDAGGTAVLVARAGAEEDVRRDHRRTSGPGAPAARSPFDSVKSSTGSVTAAAERASASRQQGDEEEDGAAAAPRGVFSR